MRNASKRGEVVTLLAIGAMIAVGLGVFFSALVTNHNANTTATRASETDCIDYPAVAAPNGYYWEADCNNNKQDFDNLNNGAGYLVPGSPNAAYNSCANAQGISENSFCKQNTIQGEVNPANSNYCYGFTGPQTPGYRNFRCMTLKYGTRPNNPTNTPAPPQATATPVPPQATATPVAPTATPPQAATPTSRPGATATPQPQPTNTPVPAPPRQPTNTPVPFPQCGSTLGCVRLSDGNYWYCNSPYTIPTTRCTPLPPNATITHGPTPSPTTDPNCAINNSCPITPTTDPNCQRTNTCPIPPTATPRITGPNPITLPPNYGNTPTPIPTTAVRVAVSITGQTIGCRPPSSPARARKLGVNFYQNDLSNRIANGAPEIAYDQYYDYRGTVVVNYTINWSPTNQNSTFLFEPYLVIDVDGTNTTFRRPRGAVVTRTWAQLHANRNVDIQVTYNCSNP